MSMKISKDTIRNRARDLPDCCAVPQQTAPPAVGPTQAPVRWVPGHSRRVWPCAPPAVGSTQAPVQWVPGHSRGVGPC